MVGEDMGSVFASRPIARVRQLAKPNAFPLLSVQKVDCVRFHGLQDFAALAAQAQGHTISSQVLC